MTTAKILVCLMNTGQISESEQCLFLPPSICMILSPQLMADGKKGQKKGGITSI